MLKTDLAPDKLPVEGAKAQESTVGISNGGEVEEFAAGKTEWTTLTLSPGRYVFICNTVGRCCAGTSR